MVFAAIAARKKQKKQKTMEIQVEEKKDVKIISISGNMLGETDSTPILSEVQDFIDQGGRNVILNLAGLKYVNSMGLGTMLTILTKARNAGGELILSNIPEMMSKLLITTKLNTIFITENNLDIAVDQLKV